MGPDDLVECIPGDLENLAFGGCLDRGVSLLIGEKAKLSEEVSLLEIADPAVLPSSNRLKIPTSPRLMAMRESPASPSWQITSSF